MTAFEIEKNKGERIVITPTEFKGHSLIDCRVHFKGAEGDWHPTKRGLTMLPKHWRQILPELTRLLDVDGEDATVGAPRASMLK